MTKMSASVGNKNVLNPSVRAQPARPLSSISKRSASSSSHANSASPSAEVRHFLFSIKIPSTKDKKLSLVFKRERNDGQQSRELELCLLEQTKKRSNLGTVSEQRSSTTTSEEAPLPPSGFLAVFFSKTHPLAPSPALLSLRRSHRNRHAPHTKNKPLPSPPPKKKKKKPAAAAPSASETSGLRHLGPAGVARATDPKANPFEKKKNAKSGAQMWTEVYELAELLKSGKSTWEDLDLDDVDVRLKVRERGDFFYYLLFIFSPIFAFCYFLTFLFSSLPPFFPSLRTHTHKLSSSGSASSTAGSAPRGNS